jgi:hypothetical protein
MLLQVFVNTELYARVSVAVLFHQLWKQIKENNIPGAEEALQSGKLFLLKLLDSAVLFLFFHIQSALIFLYLTIAFYLGQCCLKLIFSGHHLVFDI